MRHYHEVDSKKGKTYHRERLTKEPYVKLKATDRFNCSNINYDDDVYQGNKCQEEYTLLYTFYKTRIIWTTQSIVLDHVFVYKVKFDGAMFLFRRLTLQTVHGFRLR